jgi:hypothetical protein
MTSLQRKLGETITISSKFLSKNDDNLREGGFIMKVRTFIQFTTGLTLILILLAACGGGGIETNFTLNNDGFDIQSSEPKFFAEETFTSELFLVTDMRIRLEAVRGDIEIEGQDDADSVTVIAQKWVGSDSLEEAEMHLNELEILITEETEEILIQTSQPEDSQDHRYIVDYHIILPSNLEIEVTLVNGDIGVQDVQNSVVIDAVNGDVFLSNTAASAIVSLSNGSINSNMVLPLDGEIRMYTDNGNIDLGIPTSTSAVFAASVVNGVISDSNLEFDDAVQTSESLTGTLGNGEGMIDLGTVNGNISVVGLI